jgi:DNA-binding beta-propeller fold protein YncE
MSARRELPFSVLAGLVALAGLFALFGCGEKITAPEAKGIPSSSLYLEKSQWNLTDPTDLIEAAGKIFVTEGQPGTLTKYNLKGVLDKGPVTGLANPTAVCLDSLTRSIVVGESGDGATPPRLSFFSQTDLSPQGSYDLSGLAKSVAAIVTRDDLLYLADPDSGAVLRFRWLDHDLGLLQPRGEVANSRGSVESPQFVQRPAGLAFDLAGMLLVCDADTTRNWVIRFDPTPTGPDSTATGAIIPFYPTSCPTVDISAHVLGKAPGCGGIFEPGPGSGVGEFNTPYGVGIDREGRIYVADSGNGRGQRFSPSGSFDLLFGNGAGGSVPLGSPRKFAIVHGITTRGGIQVEISGAILYVVDAASAQIRVFEDKRWSDFKGGS